MVADIADIKMGRTGNVLLNSKQTILTIVKTDVPAVIWTGGRLDTAVGTLFYSPARPLQLAALLLWVCIVDLQGKFFVSRFCSFSSRRRVHPPRGRPPSVLIPITLTDSAEPGGFDLNVYFMTVKIWFHGTGYRGDGSVIENQRIASTNNHIYL